MPAQPRSRAKARREAAAQLAREDILDAAEEAFSAHGFRAATMSEIARKAGFTAASLYTYFDSKEAIFRALGQRVMENLSESLQQPQARNLSVAEGLAARLRTLFGFVEKRQRSIKMFFDLQWGVELDKDPGEQDALQLTSEWFREFFVDSGLATPELPPDVLATAMMGLVDAFLKRWLVEPDKDALGPKADLIVRLFLHGVLQPSSPSAKDP